MARFNATPNGLVPFTAEEEVSQDAQDAQNQIDLAEQTRTKYQRDRADEYPPMANYLDGIVKGDQAQIQAYIDACLAVKAKYPKAE